MTATVNYRIVSNDLPRIAAGMQAQADAIVARTALDLEAQMKVRAPVRTGFLRGSIQASRVGSGHWRVVVGADYGLFVENGTVRARPQPFVRPAVRIVRPAFVEAMRRLATEAAQ